MAEKIQRDGGFPRGGQREQWKRQKETHREPKPAPPPPAEKKPERKSQDRG